jgi:ribosomal protein S18 acetylase RimI-like enzyme
MNSYHLELKEIDTQKHLFNGRIGDTVVGQVRIEVVGELGGIYCLEIYPSFRRQGYGRELLMQTIEKLLTLGIKNIFLQVDTINENALSLYQSCGFIEKNVMKYYSISKE